MSTRIVIVGSLVVLAAAAAWWLVGGSGAGDGQGAVPGRTAAPTPQIVGGEASPAGDPAAAATPIEAARFLPETEVISPAETEEAIGPGVPFVQVQDAGGRAVPGAELEIRVGEVFSWLMSAESGDDERPPWRRMRANQDGRAALRPAPPGEFGITGRKDELTGVVRSSPAQIDPASPLILVLKPGRPVEVRVVDPAGQPVSDVRVRPSGASDVGPPIFRWTDPPDGVARFLVTALDGSAFERDTFQPVADLASSTVLAEKPVPWAESGPTKSTITIPRGVTVRVQVLNARPGRHELSWGSRAERNRRNRGGGIVMLAGPSATRSGRRVFTGPEAAVAGFPTGEKVTFCLEAQGCVGVRKAVQLPPVESVFDLLMEPGRELATLEVRIHDGTGRTPAGERFIIEVDQPEPQAAPESVNGDPAASGLILMAGGGEDRSAIPRPDGVYRLKADPDVAGKVRIKRSGGAGAGVTLAFGRAPGDEAGWLAVLPFPALEPGATFRCDPVIIAGRPALVSGRVVDAAGRPVAGAEVRCLPGSSAPAEDRGRFQRVAQSLSATSESDGRFALRGDDPGCSLEVEARLAGAAVSARVPFVSGQMDVELRLEAAGTLEGTLIKSRPDLGAIRIELRSAASGPGTDDWWIRERQGLDREADAEGRFRFPGLCPGEYEVRVRIAGHDVLTVGSVLVESGKTCRDPRLDGVTVGQAFEDAMVTVRRPDGAPVAGADVEVHAPESGTPVYEPHDSPMRARSDVAGRATFLLPRGLPRSVRVSADGCLPWSRPAVTLPVEAVLDPGCTLTVRIQGAGPLPSSDEITGWQIVAKAAGSGDSATRSSAILLDAGDLVFSTAEGGGNSGPVGEDRRATLKSLAPGKYALSIRPQKKPRRHGSGGDVFVFLGDPSGTSEGLPLGEAEIPAGVYEKSLSYPVDEEKLRELLSPPAGR